MKKLVVWSLLCVFISIPTLSATNYYNEVKMEMMHKMIDDAFNNRTSDIGTIFMNSLEMSTYNLSSISNKLSFLWCGFSGLIDDYYWNKGFCSKATKSLSLTQEDITYMLSSPGDKKTIIHNICLDVPSLIVNLSEI